MEPDYPNPNGGRDSGGSAGAGAGTTAWNESFRIGDDLIDAQHETFFRMVAEAGESRAGESPEEVSRRLNFLASYAVMHFRDEEKLMSACGFPGLAEHRRVHHEFVAQVAALLKAHEADPQAVSPQQILPLIHDWLVFHILGMDKMIQPWVERMRPGRGAARGA